MSPEVVADCACENAEGPLWHPGERRLYWTDIPRGRLFRYDPETGRHEVCFEGEVVGGFTIQRDGSLLLFMERGAIKHWRDGRLTILKDEIPEERDTRFNDVIADASGRVLCGTMPTAERPGRLYRLDLDGSLVKLLDDAGLSNGMGFTPGGGQLYHTDSKRRVIRLYAYDADRGGLSSPRVFAELPEGEDEPDGMTVDAEGYVWSARWDGGCLVRYSPSGEEVTRISLPARKISSVTFGGPTCSDMYVTTAGGDERRGDERGGNDRAGEGPGAGSIFRLRLGVRGVPEFFSRIGTA